MSQNSSAGAEQAFAFFDFRSSSSVPFQDLLNEGFSFPGNYNVAASIAITCVMPYV